MFDKLPPWMRMALIVGVLAIGPVVCLAIFIGGTTTLMFAVLGIVVYFTTLYLVGMRRFM